MKCEKCGRRLDEKDKFGSSAYVCTACGALSRPGKTDVPGAFPPVAAREHVDFSPRALDLPRRIRRIFAIRMLWGSTALLGALACVLVFTSQPRFGDPSSLAGGALGLAIGMAFVAILAYLMFGASSPRVFTGLFIVVMGVALVFWMMFPHDQVVFVAGGLTFVAGFAFAYEQGAYVELRDDAIVRVRMLPVPKTVEVAWDAVERVTADLRSVVTLGGFSTAVDEYTRLSIESKGQRISVSNVRYRAGGGDFTFIFSRCADAAIAWTVDEIRQGRSVRLGPLEISPTSLTVRGLRTWNVRLAEVRRVRIADGNVLLDTEIGEMRLTLARIPNGLYLPDIVGALRSADGDEGRVRGSGA